MPPSASDRSSSASCSARPTARTSRTSCSFDPNRYSSTRGLEPIPDARGRGLGRRMLETALDEARARAYEGVLLWTVEGLGAAHHLYATARFELTVSRPARKFGVDAVEQRMDLRF
ncbi:GNAT family N-acetyltransferase [Kitasatospora sp. NPDC056800]|uniref:GNAT family N-acetyltransferase n=1 Tax=Kitasatospora sp. NPDC056800 TaxID=3345948 RepID=UPI0036C0E8D5